MGAEVVDKIIIWGGSRWALDSRGYYQERLSGRKHWNGVKPRSLHRAMWESVHGPIPPGFDVHHRDGVRTHNWDENFECLPHAEHPRRHPGLGFSLLTPDRQSELSRRRWGRSK